MSRGIDAYLRHVHAKLLFSGLFFLEEDMGYVSTWEGGPGLAPVPTQSKVCLNHAKPPYMEIEGMLGKYYI